MGRLEGKVALITGGTSGIGLATARLFLAEGAQVIVTGRNALRREAAQAELGAGAWVLESEAGNLADIDSLMEKIQKRFNKLDVLVLNAALLQSSKFDEMDLAKFDEIMNANTRGPFFTIMKALPLLGSKGVIVAVTSIARNKGLPNANVYAASKAALHSLVRSFAVALAGRGIRVNAVAPGPIETDGFTSQGVPAATVAAMLNRLPVKRFGLPDEVARAVLFLSSDESSYMVGEEIIVDGGNACT